MKKTLLSLAALVVLSGCSSAQNTAPKKMHYEPTWESLAQYDETAEWFKDAKFGIYAHWGYYRYRLMQTTGTRATCTWWAATKTNTR